MKFGDSTPHLVDVNRPHRNIMWFFMMDLVVPLHLPLANVDRAAHS
jgi:hypothetical protein